ncbi:MAG: hypothetical protein HN929_12900 [Chloroflexi bacterium]|jgi:hypothetical protein|nr:hypothetical protein [Chloroflexota bacterium]
MAHKYDPAVAQKKADAKAQMALSDISNKTYAQVQTYVDDNVTSLATAKTVMKKMAVMTLALLKERDLSS